jgi:uncharacterized membrane protein SirB2
MLEFYPQIRLVHIACVIASGLLFALRGSLMLAGVRAYNHIALRALSWTIDTTLLTAALMLATLLHQYPFVHGWLTVKVLLLVTYIGLGTMALKRSQDSRRRAWWFIAALAVYLTIISVARAHHPLGFLHGLLGATS